MTEIPDKVFAEAERVASLIRSMSDRYQAYPIASAILAERKRCAYIASNACLVQPDGGSPTADEVAVCEEAARRIMEY